MSILLTITVDRSSVDYARTLTPLHNGIHVLREVKKIPDDDFTIQIKPVLKEGENSLKAIEVEERFRGRDVLLSELHVRALLSTQDKIPEELQGSTLLFPGIILVLDRMDFTPHPVMRQMNAMMSARYEGGKWQAAAAWLDGDCSEKEYVITLIDG